MYLLSEVDNTTDSIKTAQSCYTDWNKKSSVSHRDVVKRKCDIGRDESATCLIAEQGKTAHIQNAKLIHGRVVYFYAGGNYMIYLCLRRILIENNLMCSWKCHYFIPF
jgi:hypothetical protein